MKKLVVLALVLAVAVVGCAQVKSLFSSNNDTILQLAVESAVAQMLHDHPSWAGPTETITEEALTAIDDKVIIDLGSAAVYIKRKLPMYKLLPPEQALASTVIDTIVQSAQDYLSSRGVHLPDAQLVEVKKILTWAHDMAAMPVKTAKL